MPRGLSAYLDLFRVLAAMQVVVYHLSVVDVGALNRSVLNQWGHEAVIVFFVLSGFVVRHAAEKSDHTFAEFATSRISRLYPVVVVCLAVTVLCDLLGRAVAPDVYANVTPLKSVEHVVARTLISLLMLNQTWGYLDYFSNVPYWSLCYEFWYYFLFAAFYYGTGVRRWLAIALIANFAGAKALVLLPIWCIGVLAYTEQRSKNWNKALVWLAFLQPILVIAAYVHFDLATTAETFVSPEISGRLVFSKHFLADTFLAISLGLNLAAAKQLDGVLWPALRTIRPAISAGASRSFTLYLMHQPVMYLALALSVMLFGQPTGWFVVVSTFGLPLLLAASIENRRHAVRAWLRRCLQRLQAAPPPTQLAA
jgi:peptidoglycan/LPS O-acetylase OafA/YrhL